MKIRRGGLGMALGVAVALAAAGPARGQASAAQGARQAAYRPVAAADFTEADRLIESAIAASKLPGAVLLVGRGDEVLYRKAYGSRALAPAREPMTADTIFDLASLSKPIGCATSIMILCDRGKLALDAPVARYLPGFGANGKSRITVADLLLHRGGLPPDDPMEDYASGPAAAIGRIFAAAPTWPPETRFAYSDVGYIVLGKVVEAIDGRPLDRFAREEIFQPLQMRDTGYNPPASVRERCAPTQQREGHWMRGSVHDPRSYALGGVAGHAGVFATADDVGRFCRMILGQGRLDGRRILSAPAVIEMTRPRCLPDGTGLRSYGFDVATGYSRCRGDRFEPGVTFGHTGFTGGMFWIDPVHDVYAVLLSNSVHPDGKGRVLALRHDVMTVVADALLGPRHADPGPAAPLAGLAPARVETGLDVLEQEKFRPLAGLRVALVTNATGVDRQGRRTIDLLASAPGVRLVKIFAPEHGLLGAVDAKFGDGADPRTGLPVFSLYGSTTEPTDAMLTGVDAIVFDVQDAGARYYTYLSTMGLCMRSAAAHRVKMFVLDRPDPATGLIVDGPVADEDALGFTAFAPIPVAHGMTLGELARYLNVERRIGCDLTVVAMRGWRRSMWWDQTGLTWIDPSPNLRNPTADLLYLGLGLLEMGNVSVGRGTDSPFEIVGAPWIDGPRLAEALRLAGLPGLAFTPIEFTPTSSRFAGQKCGGVRLTVVHRDIVEPVRAALTIESALGRLFGGAWDAASAGRLLANRQTLAALECGGDPDDLPNLWRSSLSRFKAERAKYLLYAP